ncbi:hypothetical protein SDC9_129587 [bioreactor metagenome]|uniref:Uncharacterized protein n=1 Tax=bioreactor metagenome TaxID=1076179 RepID=A0A645CZE6_9ZZZZ
MVTAHIEELGAQQAHKVAAHKVFRGRFIAKVDAYFDALAAAQGRVLMQKLFFGGKLGKVIGLLFFVAGQIVVGRLGQHKAAGAIQHDKSAVLQCGRGTGHAQHGRDAVPARQNGAVRRCATHFSDDANDLAAVQRGGIAGQQITCDNNDLLR